MNYFKQQETANEIENWVKWAGDKPAILQSIKFDDAKLDLKDARLSDPVTRVGCDAQRAGRTDGRLRSLPELMRYSLVIEYTQLWTQKQKAAMCKVSVPTYCKKLADAHLLFWGQVLQTHRPESRANACVIENVE